MGTAYYDCEPRIAALDSKHCLTLVGSRSSDLDGANEQCHGAAQIWASCAAMHPNSQQGSQYMLSSGVFRAMDAYVLERMRDGTSYAVTTFKLAAETFNDVIHSPYSSDTQETSARQNLATVNAQLARLSPASDTRQYRSIREVDGQAAAGQEASQALSATVEKLLSAMPNVHLAKPTSYVGACHAVRPIVATVDGKRISGYLLGGYDSGTLKNGQEAIVVRIDDCTNHHFGGSVLVFAGPKGAIDYVGHVDWPFGAVRNGLIRIVTPIFAPGEATCCLSRAKVRLYTVASGHLKRLSETIETNRSTTPVWL
jgi:hypothetical protein